MKKIKYISAAIMIWMGLVLTGELHVLQIIHTLENAYTHASYNFGEDWRVAAKDIGIIAERNNVIAFTYNHKYQSMLEYGVELYSTQELPKEVAEKLGVDGGHFKSLLLGNVSVLVDHIDNVTTIPTAGYLFLIGNERDVCDFDRELSLIYPRMSPTFSASAGTPYNNILLMYWGIIIICILFFTLVDTFFQKKEAFVRVSLGASISSVILRNVITDMAAYFVLFGGGYLILSHLTSTQHKQALIFLVFVILVFANSSIFFILYKINHKYATSKSKIPKYILRFSYAIKAIAALAAIIAIAASLALLQPAHKYLKAYSFFAVYKDYYYCHFQYKMDKHIGSNEFLIGIRRNEAMNKAIYLEYFDKCRPIILSKFTSVGQHNDFNIIYANINAFDYIASVVNGFSMENFTSDVYFLIPDNISDSQKEEMLDIAKHTMANHSADYTYSIFYYEGDIDVICIDQQSVTNEFVFLKNPCIVFDATNPSDNIGNISPYSSAIMYRLTEEIRLEIIERFALESEITEITNVFEHYEHFWFMIKAGLYAMLLISVLMLVLEIILVFRIVDLEYTVNSIELCLKKTLGYGLWQRNLDAIIFMAAVNLLCVVMAVLMIGSLVDWHFVVFAAGIILFIDITALLWSIHRVERARISEILKGGAL